MLLPTPKVLLVIVVACFLVLFAVNGLHAGSSTVMSDWETGQDINDKGSQAAGTDADGGSGVWKEMMLSGIKAGLGK